jgi:hypothetical protein
MENKMTLGIQDMPKIECPFERELKGNDYLITPKIKEGYEWVFEDEGVVALEKLHGTNVSIIIQEGAVISMYNRTERIPFINKGKKWITEGVLEAFHRGYVDKLGDGQHFGELIGEKVNGNPYKIKGHVWIPFKTFAHKHLKYKSWGKYPKDFETISKWFEKDLMPLYWVMKHGLAKNKDGKYEGFVEGIVFHHPDGRMAKIRKDMFPWHAHRKQNQKFDPHL